jgi:acyl dehydratase
VALNKAFKGRHYPPSDSYDVTREAIRDFADAIGDENPLYRDPGAARGAGYSDVIAPPTFLIVINLATINQIVADPDLGLDYSRMVHGDQRFTFARPVVAGDRLLLAMQIISITRLAGNDFIAFRGDITDLHDKPVCTTRAQLVVRGDRS